MWLLAELNYWSQRKSVCCFFGNSKHSRCLASLWCEVQKNQGKRRCQTGVTAFYSMIWGSHPLTFVVSLCQEAGHRLCPHSVVDYTRVLVSGHGNHWTFSKFTSHTHCQLSRIFLKQRETIHKCMSNQYIHIQ